MIQANQLRIGNIVQKNGVKYVADFITIQMAHNYDPILITPEVLEKCGFEKENMEDLGDCIYIPVAEGYCINWHLGSLWVEEINTGSKYLHQLQNLYYALTGEELEVNL